MTRERLEAWLAAYGRAWERKDTEAFVDLFAPDVRYHWTPFQDPKRGREGVGEAFRAAVSCQEAIEFNCTLRWVEGQEGLAHWWCSFDRVETGHRVRLDGIFEMMFDEAGRCEVFREWWHSDEAEEEWWHSDEAEDR